ncbi:phosphoribosylamine--glycine ligase, partial [Streptomyces scabiei]
MRILVLGSGAREHAILLALKAEGDDHELFAAPGNAGIAADAMIVTGLVAEDPAQVTDYANDAQIDLVIVGP